MSFASDTLRYAARMKLEQRIQSWVSGTRDRLSGTPRMLYSARRRVLKEFGKKVTNAMTAGCEGNFAELLNNRTDEERALISTSTLIESTSDYINMSDWAECCSCHHLSTEVSETDTGDSVCDVCRDDHYRWSDCQGVYIECDDAYACYSTQRLYDRGNNDWCTQAYGRRRFSWDEYAEAFIGEDVYIEQDHDDEDGEDEDDYRENRDPPSGLSSYHGSYRDFVVRNANPNALYPSMPALGLELEVFNQDRRSVVSALRDEFTPIGGLLLESDGSLDPYRGFEIITDPLGYDEWQQMGPALCSFLLARGTKGYNTLDYPYGIHITLHRKHLSPLQEARLMMFMTARENHDFMRMISQRAYIYAASNGIDIGGVPKHNQRISTLGGLRSRMSQRKITGAGKYCPINFKPELAEIRVFQSTLNVSSFMKNLEWVWAMVEWVRDSTGSTWQHQDFVKWLGARGCARHDYSNLYNYLTRSSYGVRHMEAKVGNTWGHLLRIPNPIKGNEVVVQTCADDALIAA